jgi:hypothetical protein
MVVWGRGKSEVGGEQKVGSVEVWRATWKVGKVQVEVEKHLA